MADTPITSAFLLAEMATHSGINNALIRLTNSEDALAIIIDPPSFDYAFLQAWNEFNLLTGSTPKEEATHDVQAMLNFVMAYLFLDMFDHTYFQKYYDEGARAARNAEKRKAAALPTSKLNSKSVYSKSRSSDGMQLRKGVSGDSAYG